MIIKLVSGVSYKDGKSIVPSPINMSGFLAVIRATGELLVRMAV